MSFEKVIYTDKVTKIMAKNLNDIQNELGSLSERIDGLFEVFWASYGVTTATELGAALSAGKLIAVRYLDQIYVMSNIGDLGSDRVYYFTNVAVNTVRTLLLDITGWTNMGSQIIPSVSSANPSALGTAAPGTRNNYARADHVHPMPSASDVGALPAQIDSALSSESDNPVKNKVIASAINAISDNALQSEMSGQSVSVETKLEKCYLKGPSNSEYDATALIDGENIRVTSLNGQDDMFNHFMIGTGQVAKANGNLFIADRLRKNDITTLEYERINGRANSSAIELILFKTRCEYSVDSVNAYLHENPIRIWYKTPNYETANKIYEYIICSGVSNYIAIGTLSPVDPLANGDYIDFEKGILYSGETEEPINLSSAFADIPETCVITGSGIVSISVLANQTDAFKNVVLKDGWNEISPSNTTFFKGINYFDINKAIIVRDSFVNEYGEIRSQSGITSIIFPVKPNMTYWFFAPGMNRAFIAENDTSIFETGQIYTMLYTASSTVPVEFTTGSAAKFVFAYIANYVYDFTENNPVLNEYQYYGANRAYLSPEYLPEDSINPLTNANVLIFGDSITDTCNFTINASDETTAVTWKNPSNRYTNSSGTTIDYSMWPKMLKDLGVLSEVRNYARSGASYKDATRESGEERQNLSYQITVALNDLANPNGAFQVDNFVPDIVIFALGTNDGVPNDTYSSAMEKTVYYSDGYSIDANATLANLDKTKFCEAARHAFLRARIAFPFSQFYCVLPIQRSTNEVNGENLNTYLRKMAERYGCIIIDGFSESGIIRDLNANNALGITLKDGLHPNDKGQNMLFRAIYGAMKSHFVTTKTMNP